MAATPRPSTPDRVMLDLDALEREEVRTVGPKKDPYAVVFKGRRIEFSDPAELSLPVLMTMDESPLRFFRSTLTEDDYKHVMDNIHELTGWKANKLMLDYREYYGVDESGNVASLRR